MNEIWTQWKPIEGLKPKYDIDEIIDRMDSFKIVLSEMDKLQKCLEIHFDSGVDAYRQTNESYWLDTLCRIDKKYGEDFYVDWTFFKVQNSSYLSWLSKESFEISDSRDFIHFAFLGVDAILEVITNYEPKFKILD